LSHALSKCYDSVVQTEQIAALLIAERNRLDAAIQALQGPEKRCGRPPGRKASVPAAVAVAPATRKRTLSPAGRKAIADAARKRWVRIKAGKTSSPFAKVKRETFKKG